MFGNPRLVSFESLLLAIISIFVATGIYLSRTNVTFFEQSYIVEDGLVEWLTVAALAAGGGVCFYRAFRYRKKGAGFIFITILAGLVLILGAGEEISWGQRILEIESTEYFLKHNTQGETNIHNLKIGEVKLNKLIFSLVLFTSVAFYLLAFPLFYRYSQKLRQIFDRTGILVPTYLHLIAFIAFFLLAELIPNGKKAELVEFAGAVIFFMIILQPRNKDMFKKTESEKPV